MSKGRPRRTGSLPEPIARRGRPYAAGSMRRLLSLLDAAAYSASVYAGIAGELARLRREHAPTPLGCLSNEEIDRLP